MTFLITKKKVVTFATILRMRDKPRALRKHGTLVQEAEFASVSEARQA